MNQTATDTTTSTTGTSAGEKLIELFSQPGSRAAKLDRAYQLMMTAEESAALPVSLRLTHAAHLISAAERATLDADTEQAEQISAPTSYPRATPDAEQPQQIETDAQPGDTHPLDALQQRAAQLMNAALDTIREARTAAAQPSIRIRQ